jgi:hypothetical protein
MTTALRVDARAHLIQPIGNHFTLDLCCANGTHDSPAPAGISLTLRLHAVRM